jgi:predicted membrane protein
MAWVKRHPDWTAFIVWLLMNGLAFWGYYKDNLTIVITAIAVILVSLVFNILIKKRSLFYLFLILIPYVGMFLIWALEEKRPEKQGVQNQADSNGDNISIGRDGYEK